MQKIEMQMVVEDKDADGVIDLICDVARTGESGDGRMFVYSVEGVVRVRTIERGSEAI